MTDHYDALETRDPASREADLFARRVTPLSRLKQGFDSPRERQQTQVLR
jgi:hypothetical protein